MVFDLRGDPTGQDYIDGVRRAYIDAINPEKMIDSYAFPRLGRVLINLKKPQARLAARLAGEPDPPPPAGLEVKSWRPERPLQQGMSLDLQIFVTEDPRHLSGHILYAADRLHPGKAELFARAAAPTLYRLISFPELPLSRLMPEWPA